MNNLDIITTLRWFNEKANELGSSSFVRQILSEDSGVHLKWHRNPDGTFVENHERTGPDGESIKAFVLTFRLFIQKNDAIAIVNMATLYETSPLDETLKTKFKTTRAELNQFLHGPMDLPIMLNGKPLTRDEIMRTFIYGSLAHLNPTKKALHDWWLSIAALGAYMENELVYTLSRFYFVINNIKLLNEEVLEQLQPKM